MSSRSVIALSVSALLFFTACSQHFQKVEKVSTECGYRTVAFDSFADCMDKKLVSIESENYEKKEAPNYKSHRRKAETQSQDEFFELRKQFQTELRVLKNSYLSGATEIGKASKDYKDIYNQYDQLVLNFKNEEQAMNDRAATVAAVILVGAAVVAACQDGGCGGGGGGGSSYQNNLKCDLQGCCSYHGGVQGVGLVERFVSP